MSATQDGIEGFSIAAGIGAFDSAAVVRFINDSVNNKPVDDGDMKQAAALLAGLMRGVLLGDDIGKEFRRLMGMRKKRNNMFDPGSAYINSTAFDIVLQLERCQISLKEAIDAFNGYVAEADEKTIKSWIEAIRPRARKISEMFAALEKKEG